MARIEVDTKFDIGDMVTLKAMDDYCKPEQCQPFAVVEILAQRCYGGLQVHYDCRPIGRGEGTWHEPTHFSTRGVGSGGNISFVEVELVALPPEYTDKARAAANESKAK